MTERLRWAIQRDGDFTLVKIEGSVDEDADFTGLIDQTKDGERLRINLSGISRINSCGVREWVNFVRSFPENQYVEFEACSPVVVSQINMISNFVGRARIVSVHAPFMCDACGHEENVLVLVDDGSRSEFSEIACPKCRAAMEFDDIEDSYFAFLP